MAPTKLVDEAGTETNTDRGHLKGTVYPRGEIAPRLEAAKWHRGDRRGRLDPVHGTDRCARPLQQSIGRGTSYRRKNCRWTGAARSDMGLGFGHPDATPG